MLMILSTVILVAVLSTAMGLLLGDS